MEAAEFKRNRYFWKKWGKGLEEQKKQARFGKRLDPDEALSIEPAFLNPSSLLPLLTRNIHSGLIVNLTDPWLLGQTNIWEKALGNLASLLTDVKVTANLRQQAWDEYSALVRSLDHLFAGNIPLKRMHHSESDINFEGYYRLDEKGRRVSIHQKLYSTYSDKVQQSTDPTCQISFKEIKGISDRGRAIAEDDTSLRCGLRHTIIPGKFSGWVISIDAGLRDRRERIEPHWEKIRPLSDVIFQYYQQVQGLTAEDKYAFTFHYNHLASNHPQSENRI